MRKSRRILRRIFKITGADKIFYSYFVFFLIISILILIIEPDINRLGDSLWYCFVAATTIGFGDIAAVTFFGRILTIILSVYSLGVVAIFTGVITSYFMENAKAQAGENVRKFLDDLENLDKLSKDELKELSSKVKKFNKRFWGELYDMYK